MTPVYQTPYVGDYGDCFPACIASLLDLPLSHVPHFFDGTGAGNWVMTQEETRRLQVWFTARGLYYFEVGLTSDLDSLLDGMGDTNPDLHYLLTGRGPGGTGHSVVAFNDRVIHNPSGGKLPGLVAPHPDGAYRIGLIAKNL